MLGFIFGFNARLGRLHFMMCTLALSVVTGVLTAALAFYTIGYMPQVALSSIDIVWGWPWLVMIGLSTVVALLLQAMRVRDIGWDPVMVMPAWIALVLVDKFMAVKLPAWSVGDGHYGTVVGGLINLALLALLMFMPGETSAEPVPGAYGGDRPPEVPRDLALAPTAARIAHATRTKLTRF
jgi:uncharacterized membrane protein YhaH (DUF805 family)